MHHLYAVKINMTLTIAMNIASRYGNARGIDVEYTQAPIPRCHHSHQQVNIL